MKKCAILFFLLFTCFGLCLAQSEGNSVLSGTLTSTQDQRPVPNVNIFLSNTMLGSATDSNGHYQITHISSGRFWLVISHVAFRDTAIEVDIREKQNLEFNCRLKPKVYQVTPIVVTPDMERLENLEKFTKAFIGTSEHATQTKIENITELRFKISSNNALLVSSDRPLIITNKALGYRIDYSLFHFEAGFSYVKYTGFPKFSYLHSQNADTVKLWQKNRQDVFKGSLRHFLYLICTYYELSDGALDEPEFQINYSDRNEQGFKKEYTFDHFLKRNGFEVLYKSTLKPPFGMRANIAMVNTNTYLTPATNPNEYFLKFKNYLEVKFKDPKNDETRISWITLSQDSVLIDKYGRYYQTFGINTSGYWGSERMADSLPFEYDFKDD